MKIGNRLKELRKAKRMTLAVLSGKSGVALATLSRMENNKMTGTIEAHTNICNALGVSLSDLYLEIEDTSKTVDSVPLHKRPEHLIHSKKAQYELLVTKTQGKKIMPLIMELKAGGETQQERNKFGVEKFIYLMEGAMDALIGKDLYELHEGDSLYLDASLPHMFRNTSAATARAICIVSPPSL